MLLVKKMYVQTLCSLVMLLMLVGHQAQAQSAFSPDQAPVLTSISLVLDSVSTERDMETVRTLINQRVTATNFDIKGGKCNFTLRQSEAEQNLDDLYSTLENAGYPVKSKVIRSHQMFTTAPVDHKTVQAKAEVTEEMARKQREQKTSNPPR